MRLLLVFLGLMAPAAAWADPASIITGLYYVAGLLTSVTVIKAVAYVALLAYGAASARRKKRAAEAKGKAEYNANLQDRAVTALQALPAWRIIPGRAWVGCDVHAIFTSDKTGYREDGTSYTRPDALKHLVCVFADHECAAIHDVAIGGVPLGAFDDSGQVTSGDYFFTETDSQFVILDSGGSASVGRTVLAILGAYTRDQGGEGGSFTDVLGSTSGAGTTTITGPANAYVNYTVQDNRADVRVQKHLGSPNQGSADTYLVNVMGGAALSTQFNTTSDLESWTTSGMTSATVANGVLTIDSSGADPIIRRGSLSFAGTTYRTVRARIRRTAGSGWEGSVYYTTGGHGESGSFVKTATEPIYDDDSWAVVEWDMASLSVGGSDWTSSTITGIRLDLGASAADTFEVDWIDVIATSATWQLSDRLVDKCYLVVTLDLERAEFQVGIPQITADISGRKVYDPRKDSTVSGGSGSHLAADSTTWEWSDNAALAVRDYLGAEWGFDNDPDDIDEAYTIAAANACDARTSASVQAHSQAFTVDASTNEIIFASDEFYGVGDGVRVSTTTTLPSPLAAATTYYIIRGDTTSTKRYQLATTAANAYAGTAIDITTSGTGTHTATWHDYAMFKANGMFVTEGGQKEAILDDLAASMAGDAFYGAQWQIVAGAYVAPVMALTDDDLAGNIEILQGDTPLEQLINGVRGTYIATGKATPAEFDSYTNSTFVTDDGQELWDDLALEFVDSRVRARNLARILVETTRNGQIIRYPAKLKAWPLQVGDRVTVTNTEYGFSSKVYRVTDWQFGLTSPVLLTLQEDASTAWDIADAATSDQTLNTGLPSPWVVEQLTLDTPVADATTGRYTSDGTWIPRIHVTWDAPTGAYLADGAGRIVVLWRTASSDDWQRMEVLSNETGTFIEGVREGAPVVIEVYAINGLRQAGPSSFTAIYVDITGNGVIGGGNLLVNSSFEVDSDANGLADSWNNGNSGTYGAVTASLAAGGLNNGNSQLLEITNLGATTSDSVSVYQTINVLNLAGSKAVVSGWMICSVPDTELGMIAAWFEAGAVFISQDLVTFPQPSGSTTLLRYSMVVDIPADTETAVVYFFVRNRAGGAGAVDFYVDGVQFEAGSVLTAYAPRADELLAGVVTQPHLEPDARGVRRVVNDNGPVTITEPWHIPDGYSFNDELITDTTFTAAYDGVAVVTFEGVASIDASDELQFSIQNTEASYTGNTIRYAVNFDGGGARTATLNTTYSFPLTASSDYTFAAYAASIGGGGSVSAMQLTVEITYTG
jgi:hypothetical protein